jgi:hypothetical protein
MPRIPRLLNDSESTVYHVMSRTALDGFPLGGLPGDIIKRKNGGVSSGDNDLKVLLWKTEKR